MKPYGIFIGYSTLVRKEVQRFMRLWIQTILPSVITSSLYFLIFGAFIGSRIGEINGYSYMQFILPGLVMLSVITNSFQDTVSVVFFAKFQRNIEEILVSPLPNWVTLLAFLTGGILRGLLVGVCVLLVGLFFTQIVISHIFITIFSILLCSTLFSFAGILNAMFAKSFDSISIFPTFILTPLTYLGGIFYSISSLGDFWGGVSKLNPILYMVDIFRYGFLGFSDTGVIFSLFFILFVTIVLGSVVWYLFDRGYGLKS